MAIFVNSDDKKGNTTVRHSWRIEIFSDFGSDPILKAHRAQVVYDTETEEPLSIVHDRVVTRNLSELAEGPRGLFENLASLCDQWEVEDDVSGVS
jgi:hypothetical protein